MNQSPLTDQKPNFNQDEFHAVLRGRTEILETRFEVAAVQIVERLRIRAQNLQQILDEDLEIGSRRLSYEAGSLSPNSIFHELDSRLREKQSGLDRERRMEDKECWRDLIAVMRDLLNAWDGLTQAKAKERFLQTLPKPTENMQDPRYQIPLPPSYQNHENRNTFGGYHN